MFFDSEYSIQVWVEEWIWLVSYGTKNLQSSKESVHDLIRKQRIKVENQRRRRMEEETDYWMHIQFNV